MSVADTIAMEADEVSVCEVVVRYGPRVWAGMGFAVLASAAFAGVAFHLHSTLTIFDPVLATIIGGAGSLYFGVLALKYYHGTRDSQYLLTSRRIIALQRNGQQLWEGGFDLDFFRACKTKASIFLPKLSVPTLMKDHGHPEWVDVGPLAVAQTTHLSGTFDKLRAAWLSARAAQVNSPQSDGEDL